MDCRTGEIIPAEKFEGMRKSLDETELQFYKQMNMNPTTKQLKSMKVGRNDPCPCGSGKKFKKCCLVLVKEKESEIM